MESNFVTKEVCDLKHKEVSEVKQELKTIKVWLYTLVGAAMANLIVQVIKLSTR